MLSGDDPVAGNLEGDGIVNQRGGQQLSGRRRVGVAALIGGAAAVVALTYGEVVREAAQRCSSAARWEGAGAAGGACYHRGESFGIGVNFQVKKQKGIII